MTMVLCWKKFSTFRRHLCAASSDVVYSDFFNTAAREKEKGVRLQCGWCCRLWSPSSTSSPLGYCCSRCQCWECWWIFRKIIVQVTSPAARTKNFQARWRTNEKIGLWAKFNTIFSRINNNEKIELWEKFNKAFSRLNNHEKIGLWKKFNTVFFTS